MTYDTMNPVPSTDPRDLDDNAQALDRFLLSTANSEPDRLGVPRRTWKFVEAAAEALVNPNVIGLAAVTPAQNKAFYFTGTNGAMATYDTGELGRILAGVANTEAGKTAGRSALGALSTTENAASAAKLATARSISATGDATWTVNFDGMGNATGALTLSNVATAGTYTLVSVNAKGLVTGGSTAALPVANGGTAGTTQATARTGLGLGTASVVNTGTSGATVPLLNGVNTWSQPNVFASITPITDGGTNLGGAALRWGTVYAVTGTINTSDANHKTAVEALSNAEILAAQDLANEIGVFQYLDAVASKGGAARKHTGMTVQRAIEIMEVRGLEPFAYGFICYDEWDAQPEIGEEIILGSAYDSEGLIYENVLESIVEPDMLENGWRWEETSRSYKVVTQAHAAGSRYGFRVDELTLFIQRGQQAVIDSFDKRLRDLESAK